MKLSLFTIMLLFLLGSCGMETEKRDSPDKKTSSFRERVNKGEIRVLDTTYSPRGKTMLLHYKIIQPINSPEVENTYTAIVNEKDLDSSIDHLAFSDRQYTFIRWSDYQQVTLDENYNNYIRSGKWEFEEDAFTKGGVRVIVNHQDPLDSTFKRKIMFRQPSPENLKEVVAYRYYHPHVRGEYLHISVISKGDSLPKYGNFHISNSFEWDCINDIKWDGENRLIVYAAKECYGNLDDYLNVNRPGVEIIKKEWQP